jgi:hypothetical protein
MRINPPKPDQEPIFAAAPVLTIQETPNISPKGTRAPGSRIAASTHA